MSAIKSVAHTLLIMLKKWQLLIFLRGLPDLSRRDRQGTWPRLLQSVEIVGRSKISACCIVWLWHNKVKIHTPVAYITEYIKYNMSGWCLAYIRLFQTQTLSESKVFYDIPGMKSTCVARAHPSRHQTTGDLIRQRRRTAEHLRVPLLFARDNPECNDVVYNVGLHDDSEYNDDVDGMGD